MTKLQLFRHKYLPHFFFKKSDGGKTSGVNAYIFEWKCLFSIGLLHFKDGWWEFSCSLKNYEGEIEQFVEFIRPMIEKVEEFWSLYEEYPMHEDYIDTFEHWGKFRTHHLRDLI